MKRLAGASLTKTEEKKARLEAGLHLNVNQDFTSLQIDNILKEVSVPSSIAQQLTGWKVELIKYLKSFKFVKLKQKQVTKLLSSNTKYDIPEGFTFSGGAVTDVVLGCRLSADNAHTLVFPNATGQIYLDIKFEKSPKSAKDLNIYNDICLLQLFNGLSSHDSILQCEQSSSVLDGDSRLMVVPNLQKLKNQLKVFLEIRSEGVIEAGVSNSLQDEINRLLSNENYRQSEQLLQIWVRQIKLWLPESFMTSILLHLHILNQLNIGMKPWSVVRRVWTFMSECKEHQGKIILGVVTPIPDTSFTSPLLDRDGTRSLFPDLTRVQWNTLCSFAEGALNIDLKESLLVKHSVCALFDKVFRFTGSNIDLTKLIEDLSYALGERVLRISCLEDANDGLLIGFILNPSQYHNQATLGPTADDPEESKRFRQFWGERSELRRFQDGVVRETLVWSKDKKQIIGDILRAVVNRHWHKLHITEYNCWADKILVGDGGEQEYKYLSEITPILHELDGLALPIVGVTSISQEWRHSRVGVKTCGWNIGSKSHNNHFELCEKLSKGEKVPPYVPVMDVMIQPARSGKWPRDAEAVRRLYIAWLSEVGSAMEKKLGDIEQFICGENLMVVNIGKEIALRFHVSNKKLEDLSELSSWLGSIAVISPAWSPGVRLAKRWISSQFMSDIVSDTAIELIMARVFLRPGQFCSPPVSAVCAFQRWLEILSTHDWNEAPLLVTSDSFFSGERKSLPPLAVVSSKDPSPSFWSSPGPSWAELNRLVKVAHLSLEQLDTKDKEVDHLKVLSPSLESFEFLIQLNPAQISNRNLAIGSKSKQVEEKVVSKDDRTLPVLEYNPALKLVQELNQSFDNIAKFYYDKYGGSVIGVKVKKDVQKQVKIGKIGGHITRGKETELNWGAIVEDWKILGQGIVASVKCQNSSIFC